MSFDQRDWQLWQIFSAVFSRNNIWCLVPNNREQMKWFHCPNVPINWRFLALDELNDKQWQMRGILDFRRWPIECLLFCIFCAPRHWFPNNRSRYSLSIQLIAFFFLKSQEFCRRKKNSWKKTSRVPRKKRIGCYAINENKNENKKFISFVFSLVVLFFLHRNLMMIWFLFLHL